MRKLDQGMNRRWGVAAAALFLALAALAGCGSAGHKTVTVTMTTPEAIGAWIGTHRSELKAKAKATCKSEHADVVNVHVASDIAGGSADYQFVCKDL
jgi:hypothetical protein